MQLMIGYIDKDGGATKERSIVKTVNEGINRVQAMIDEGIKVYDVMIYG